MNMMGLLVLCSVSSFGWFRKLMLGVVIVWLWMVILSVVVCFYSLCLYMVCRLIVVCLCNVLGFVCVS